MTIESSDPAISVVIPVAGAAPELERCVQALGRQKRAPAEVIVVDNGGERIAERVASVLPDARVVAEDRPGSYAARNRGIAEARGEVLAFTDADCEPAVDWLASAVERMRRTGATVLAGSVELRPSPFPNRTPAEVLELLLAFPQDVYVRQGFGVTANLVIDRRALEAAGLFDGELTSGGDHDWGVRAKRAGHPARFEPSVRVTHPPRRTAEELLNKERRVVGGFCQLVRNGVYGRAAATRVVVNTLMPPVVTAVRLLKGKHLAPLPVRARAVPLLVRMRAARIRVLARCAITGGTR